MNPLQIQANRFYSEPAVSLLSLGEFPQNNESVFFGEWPDYVEQFGLSLNDVPSLIQMLTDEQILDADSKDPIAWTDIHAWRALGQLRSVEAIPHLINLLEYEEDGDISDLPMEEIPIVLGMIGPDAIGPLTKYINDPSKGVWGVVAAARALERIGKLYPESRGTCIAILSKCLENYQNHSDIFNGFLVLNLVRFQAVEQLDLIRKAFNENAVDIALNGDLEETEIQLGVRQERSTPRPDYGSIILKNVFGEDGLDEESLDDGHSCGDPFCDEHHFCDDIPYVRMTPKIGRNDPCLCGSGKKYKKCCLE